ncbi:MAG TPA: Asp-tRNA(Asn)/Glu-tRNA(Gln) amidotransferase subunit GatC [Bryobacteraceae bacterium]|nr:Asp-tRNA(Asn)/Glu-tRNA(Gln) amidotransferase subunit GatC [Bryobacteraceae bacterium]
MKLSEDDVRRVAALANLALSDTEIQKMTRDLEGILTHIDKLNELDTSGVEPMAQVSIESGEDALREDEERATLGTETALANAPLANKEGAGAGYFKVPKVIER